MDWLCLLTKVVSILHIYLDSVKLQMAFQFLSDE